MRELPVLALRYLLACLVTFGRECDRFRSAFAGRPVTRAGDALLGALIALGCTFFAAHLFESCFTA